jgi:HD superfamily phosphohydrolase YqeK
MAVAVDHEKALKELDALVAETYQLWDEEWVGFSWRNYTYDHVARVRALARTIGAREGGDDLVIRYGATLHDITKSFDGEILTTPDGKRVTDENGLWLNDYLPPARANKLTELYDRLDLHRTVHSKSGAAVANALLEEYGLSPAVRQHVQEVIHTHLMPGPDSSVEGKALYDADTIDANIGLPAFYRNIQISLHGQDNQYARRGERFVDWLRENLAPFLDGYLKEKIPTWIDGKQRDFVGKMTTEAGRRAAQRRIDRLRQVNDGLVEEMERLEDALERGRLAVVRYFMENRSNPQMTQQLALLEQRWSGDNHVPTTAELLRLIREEVEGHS